MSVPEPFVPLAERMKPCDSRGCKGEAYWSNSCGAFICDTCDKHLALTRCWCGWSESGRDGRRELVEMGETIGDDMWDCL